MEEDSLELRVLRLGEMRFADLERYQMDLARDRIARRIPDTLIVAEHPYTLTTGIRSRDEHHHIDLRDLPSYGIDFHEAPDRGGSTTILGPGQLTFYPVVDVAPVKGIKAYMDVIERIVHGVATDLGVRSEVGEEYSSTYDKPYHCVWHVDDHGVRHKMLAQGYRHQLNGSEAITVAGGFSIYLTKDAHKHFHLIDHCGFKYDEVPPISFAEIAGREFDRADVEKRIIDAYAKRFEYTRVLE